MAADRTEQVEPNDSGGVINPQTPQEFEDSIISKKATYTGTPGEYFIDLKVQGKEKLVKEPTDIVLVYDNSNSMTTNNRVTIAQQAVTNFINQTLTADNDNIRMALVTFGTNVLDGRKNQIYAGNTDNYSYKTLTKSANTLINKVPTNTPRDRGRANDGGTNIQEGLQVAKEILNSSNAKNKIIITITDGSPTISYEKGVLKGNGTSFNYETNKNHGTNTITEAKAIQSSGINMYSIGIELTGDAGATKEQVTYVMQNIASSPDQYYSAGQASELADILTSLSKNITGTIQNGKVTDPMSEYVDLALTDGQFKRASNDQLTDGSYYLSASDPKLLTGVTVEYENNTITLGSLMLGKDQFINIRYKVNINTDKESFNGEDYFPSNGTTTLIPNTKDPNSPSREFIVPKVQGITFAISGTKIWEDKGGESNRPSEIELELYRTTGDRSNGTLVDTVTVTPDSNDEWKYDFGMKPAYSSIGQMYDYYIKEISVDGYTTTYSKETFDVTNTLIAEPKIELTKTSDVDTITNVGQKVTYTFEIKNTGNITLNKIKLDDPMLGGDIELDKTTLAPGESITVSKDYTVTQNDIDSGNVHNIATVKGEDPKGNTSTDEDDVTVVGTQDPQLTLEKTSDTKEVTEVGQVVTYNFKVTNNGNVTMKNIVLDDPMLGGDIELDKTTLVPGESITVSKEYTITQSDIDKGNIHNIATV
ncbi:DUF7507 domain-containing protein, partial [Nosocomiicoccus massiliensis]|uniref:DUF7507 domain-containing protein n=1 Tax=Nosocomiicoccus massiliensis TaxID=1232430 RepID=UPI0005935790